MNTFILNNPNWKSELGVYKSDDQVFQRLCIKVKKRGEYHACINVSNGDIYLDDTKRVIFLKHLGLLFARPLHTCMLTLWNLSIIGPLALEIIKYRKGEQTRKELTRNTFRNLADIVRIPLYGMAMTIVHLAGLILGCISPNSLYKTRELVGALERRMWYAGNDYGNFHSDYILSRCFSPMRNMLILNGKLVNFTIPELKEKNHEYGAHRIAENQDSDC